MTVVCICNRFYAVRHKKFIMDCRVGYTGQGLAYKSVLNNNVVSLKHNKGSMYSFGED